MLKELAWLIDETFGTMMVIVMNEQILNMHFYLFSFSFFVGFQMADFQKIFEKFWILTTFFF